VQLIELPQLEKNFEHVGKKRVVLSIGLSRQAPEVTG
jgi:hypothetical protein